MTHFFSRFCLTKKKLNIAIHGTQERGAVLALPFVRNTHACASARVLFLLILLVVPAAWLTGCEKAKEETVYPPILTSIEPALVCSEQLVNVLAILKSKGIRNVSLIVENH